MYRAGMISLNKEIISEANKLIFDFIWKPRESWGKRLMERLQEDPLFLKNPFAHERGLLIGAAQSQ